MNITTDVVSKKVWAVLRHNPDGAYRDLVARGAGDAAAAALIEPLGPGDILAVPLVREEQAQAMLCGLWLYHDLLDRSHTIAQGLHNPTGSLWHAIMHRREGDFSNSKYWLNRCGNHPAFPLIAPLAAATTGSMPADKMVLRCLRGGWDPAAMVDLAEAADNEADTPRRRAAVALQQIEWKTLFDYCARTAAGGAG